MKIEKINENKLKIILSKQDLVEKNIDVHFFNKNSAEVQELFWDILHEAEMQYDFDLTQSQLLVEGMYNSGDNFILTVTRINNNNDNLGRKQPELNIKRKYIPNTNFNTIYSFLDFEDFTAFCYRIKRLPKKYINTLYFLNNVYYLNFSNLEENTKLSKKISHIICDYTECSYNLDILKNKLLEFGEIVIAENAVQTINKYF